MTVGSLNGAGSASLTAAEDAVITNSSSSAAILEVGGNGNTSTSEAGSSMVWGRSNCT